MKRILGLGWALGSIVSCMATNTPTDSPRTPSPTSAPTHRPTYAPTQSPSNSPHPPIYSPDILQTLVGTSGFGPVGNGAQVGVSMDVSLDGQVMVMGSSTNTQSHFNAAWVYKNVGGTWAQQAVLQPNEDQQNILFGWNVAISANGSRVIVGAPEAFNPADNIYSGIFIYDYNERLGTWTQDQPTLFIPNPPFAHQTIQSLALSGDGNLILAGCPYDAYYEGAAFMFELNHTTDKWLQIDLLQNTQGLFGGSVDLSYDGSTAAVGTQYDDNYVAYAFIFIRSTYDQQWYQQGPALIGPAMPSNYDALDGITSIVSLSSDGNTLVLKSRWAVYVFSREVRSGLWTESQVISIVHAVKYVALSPNGLVISVSYATDDDPTDSSVNIYVYDAGTVEWVLNPHNTGTFASDATYPNEFGQQLAFSYDASVLFISGPRNGDDNNQTGGAWLYEYSSSPVEEWVQKTNVLVPSINLDRVKQGVTFGISQDASRVAIGSRHGIWMFEQNAEGVWEELNGGVVLRTNLTGDTQFGIATVISLDGSTIAAGEPFADPFGSVWIFIHHMFPNGTSGWLQQAGPLRMRNDDVLTIRYFGSSLAISGDGNTLVGSAVYNDQTVLGVFIRDAQGDWSQQGPMIHPPCATSCGPITAALAMTADGSFFVAGSTSYYTGVSMYARVSNGTWMYKGALVGVYNPGISEMVDYGYALAMNNDGTVVTFEGYDINSHVYVVFTFMKDALGSWIQLSNNIVLVDQQPFVSLSYDVQHLAITTNQFLGIYSFDLEASRWTPNTLNPYFPQQYPPVNIISHPASYLFFSDYATDYYRGAVFVSPGIEESSAIQPLCSLSVSCLFVLVFLLV